MTCLDCTKRNRCFEWSRLTPCSDFEKRERRNMEGIKNVENHRNQKEKS